MTQLFLSNFEVYLIPFLVQYLQSFGGLAGLPNLAGNANPLATNPLFGGNNANGNGVITTSRPVVKVGLRTTVHLTGV